MRTDIATSVKVRALTEQEEDSLRRYEEAIGRGLRSFVEVGRALQAIRDGRLYRATHRSFGEYCRDRWQMGRAHANRYIDGSTVVGLLSPIGDIPANESQARPLTRIRNAKGDLDREMIRKVWARIVASAPTYPGGRRQITARIIEAEVLPLVLRRQHGPAGSGPSRMGIPMAYELQGARTGPSAVTAIPPRWSPCRCR